MAKQKKAKPRNEATRELGKRERKQPTTMADIAVRDLTERVEKLEATIRERRTAMSKDRRGPDREFIAAMQRYLSETQPQLDLTDLAFGVTWSKSDPLVGQGEVVHANFPSRHYASFEWEDGAIAKIG
jgi:hypothetical protein